MGGTGLRGAHTERRCAGVVDAVGLAGGEMSEAPLDDLASSLRERHFRGASMQAMTRNVAPHTAQCSMSMWKTRSRRCIQLMGGRRRVGFAGGWMSPVGDDVVAVIEVRGEHAVVSGEMDHKKSLETSGGRDR